MVSQPIYATPAELATHLGLDSPPPRAEVWLRRASQDLDVLLITAVYDVDNVDMPTDPGVVDTLRDAVCEQAELLITVDDPTGAKARFARVKIQQTEYVSAVDPRSGRPVQVAYSSRALSGLRAAGLLPGVVYGRG